MALKVDGYTMQNKRLKIIQELKDEAETFQRDHEASQAEFQARILKELTICRNSINQECQVISLKYGI